MSRPTWYIVADDAGALLVRSGLVSSSALDDARVRVASVGGTLGEQLVASGLIADDALTDFYRQRLLVPQVNPNTLARLPVKVIAAIPSDMAIELRAIPVSIDGDNNLTVAMSDPSDRHAVDEIAFFTGAYVVRAVATQMQIAWCLAHYYGHLTALGHKLIQSSQQGVPQAEVAANAAAPQRAKGVTGKVDAARHRAIAPLAGPIVDVVRPRGSSLDAPNTTTTGTTPAPAAIARVALAKAPAPQVATANADATPAAAAAEPAHNDSGPIRAVSEPEISDGVPDKPSARSISGEIRVPIRRAASIKPPMPDAHEDDDDLDDDVPREVDEPDEHDDDGPDDEADASDSAPVITMEADEAPDPAQRTEDPTGPRKLPPRRRVVKTDPPELAARAGEVDVSTGPVRKVDDASASIIIAEDLEPPRPPPILPETSGELRVSTKRDDAAMPTTTVEVDDTSVGVVIHDHYGGESEPVLLDRRRPSDQPTNAKVHVRAPSADGDEDEGEDEGDDEEDVVVLSARKPKPSPRPERHTQVGIGAHAAVTRAHHDTESGGTPDEIDDIPTGSRSQVDDDPTRLDAQAAPPRGDDSSDEIVAPPPPAGSREDDTSPRISPPAPGSGARAASAPSLVARAAIVHGDPDAPVDHEDDDDDATGPATTVMSAVELDDVIPQRTAEVVPAHLSRRRIDYDPVDDGWGPPGTTIPPPLLGAIPGSDDEEGSSRIPMPDVDSAPLIVAPPAAPETTRGAVAISDTSGTSLVRALEEATSRSIELIHALERTSERDSVVKLMIGHLAETHRRAGFFSIKPTATRSNELTLFAMQPPASITSMASLLLDRPSTLQDVVGTRLPYRGPMHDDASRTFLSSVLGACPPEILLVPVTVRERVVGVLFGEHRMRHTFDDQLALAARAAGMALERILIAKRS